MFFFYYLFWLLAGPASKSMIQGLEGLYFPENPKSPTTDSLRNH